MHKCIRIYIYIYILIYFLTEGAKFPMHNSSAPSRAKAVGPPYSGAPQSRPTMMAPKPLKLLALC